MKYPRYSTGAGIHIFHPMNAIIEKRDKRGVNFIIIIIIYINILFFRVVEI